MKWLVNEDTWDIYILKQNWTVELRSTERMPISWKAAWINLATFDIVFSILNNYSTLIFIKNNVYTAIYFAIKDNHSGVLNA